MLARLILRTNPHKMPSGARNGKKPETLVGNNHEIAANVSACIVRTDQASTILQRKINLNGCSRGKSDRVRLKYE